MKTNINNLDLLGVAQLIDKLRNEILFEYEKGEELTGIAEQSFCKALDFLSLSKHEMKVAHYSREI